MIAHYKTHRGKVFDANGLEWKHMRWVNTETGEGEQAVLDANGQKQLDAAKKALLTQPVTLPAPVLFMPQEPIPMRRYHRAEDTADIDDAE